MEKKNVGEFLHTLIDEINEEIAYCSEEAGCDVHVYSVTATIVSALYAYVSCCKQDDMLKQNIVSTLRHFFKDYLDVEALVERLVSLADEIWVETHWQVRASKDTKCIDVVPTLHAYEKRRCQN